MTPATDEQIQAVAQMFAGCSCRVWDTWDAQARQPYVRRAEELARALGVFRGAGLPLPPWMTAPPFPSRSPSPEGAPQADPSCERCRTDPGHPPPHLSREGGLWTQPEAEGPDLVATLARAMTLATKARDQRAELRRALAAADDLRREREEMRAETEAFVFGAEAKRAGVRSP